MIQEPEPKVKADAVTELPLLIADTSCQLFGVLRTAPSATKILVLIPAFTGTRIGPQNLYVDIARHIGRCGIASLCIELPPSGDSYATAQPVFENSSEKYNLYLGKILAHLTTHYAFTEYYFATISLTALPVLDFCAGNGLSGTILLSPNHLENTQQLVHKKNLKSYFLKLFLPQTWKKVFALQLNFGKIISNIFGSRLKSEVPAKKLKQKPPAHKVKVLCIFGEKDRLLGGALEYWNKMEASGKTGAVKTEVIEGADHSFFGWELKQRVCGAIAGWLNTDNP